MLKTTSDLARKHLEYTKTLTDKSELKQFDTIYDHMHYYLTVKLGMSDNDATAVVKDFYADFQRVPDIERAIDAE